MKDKLEKSRQTSLTRFSILGVATLSIFFSHGFPSLRLSLQFAVAIQVATCMKHGVFSLEQAEKQLSLYNGTTAPT